MLKSAEHEIYSALIVGILKFISRINNILRVSENEKGCRVSWNFYTDEQFSFHALSSVEHESFFITSGPGVDT